MPDYEEAAVKHGWVKHGLKWHHKSKPGVEYYNAKPLYYAEVTDRRPDSITPRDLPKPVVAVPPGVDVILEGKPIVGSDDAEWAAPKKRGRPPKR